MKKLLILLVCGFAFTQSIQTKQVEVTITDWSLLEDSDDEYCGECKEIDFSNYLDLNGNYIIRVDDWEILDESFNGSTMVIITRCNDNYGLGPQYIEYYDGSPQFAGMYNGFMRMHECHKLNLGLDFELSSTFTFWVTGMFEDEGVGLQGDMNDDDIINVTDIIALVNIIIDEE